MADAEKPRRFSPTVFVDCDHLDLTVRLAHAHLVASTQQGATRLS